MVGRDGTRFNGLLGDLEREREGARLTAAGRAGGDDAGGGVHVVGRDGACFSGMRGDLEREREREEARLTAAGRAGGDDAASGVHVVGRDGPRFNGVGVERHGCFFWGHRRTGVHCSPSGDSLLPTAA